MIDNKIKNNMLSSGLTRRSRNKDLRADWMPDQVGHDRKNEQGRSMTEMLGVLAVVGVLSIGGIAGYTYAMDRHHANEIIHGVSMMAMTASQGLMINGDFTLDEYGEELSGYAFEYDTNHSKQDDDFSITIKAVGEGVCERIMDFEWHLPHDIEVNGVSYGECEDENDIAFVFTDDLGGAWEEQMVGYCDEEICVNCPADTTPICTRSDTIDDVCICVPPGETGVCKGYGCISCPEGETPKCSYFGRDETACACVSDENKRAKCNIDYCITCPEGQIAKCGTREECICIPEDMDDGENWLCTYHGCIVCSEGETPSCSSAGCFCIADGEELICNDTGCINCPKGETAIFTEDIINVFV